MSGRRREAGVVMVVVLVFALLLTSTVATFVRRATVDRMIAHNRDAAARAESIARGGVRFATVLLLEDVLMSQTGSTMDTRDDLWAMASQGEIPLGEDASIRLHIQDQGELLNLNAVFQLDADGAAHANATPMLEALLEKVIEEMPIPPGEKIWDVPELVANLIDYADSDDVRQRGGAEDDAYQRRDPPQRAANRPLLSLEELRVVEGFDARLVEALRPYLTVYPYGGTTGVNVNTAPPHVLALLFFDDGVDLRLAPEDTVRAILRVRQEGGHVCPAGQVDEQCTPMNQIVSNSVYPPPTFESDVFVVRAEAVAAGVRRTVEAVLDRKSGGQPVLLSWRVL
ncbi:MAG: type II secretion system minor pseudopilin GspK [Myxococcota bacterium]